MQITVLADNKNNKNILSLLEEMGYVLPCNCHGGRHCSGSRYDFDCAMIPGEPVTVTLPDTAYFAGTDDGAGEAGQGGKQDSGRRRAPGRREITGVALEDRPRVPGRADTLLIDLGTTTVALVLMDRTSGDVRQTTVFENPQRTSGADVISRIRAACGGRGKLLTEQIRTALAGEADSLCRKNGQSADDIRLCLIGGNTTMIHLLMGYDCTPLSASPFVPDKNSPAPFPHGSALVQILPWLSAFVGGDITAGIRACGLETSKAPSLFLDLGTNGEMVLAHGGHLYAAATATGPALEGGNLSCGCAATPGAISRVRLVRGRAQTTTIGNRIPVGLCGSGAISLCAELLRHGFLDSRGVLTDTFPPEGIFLGRTARGRRLLFTADDLRELQLAVAAIGAGIDTLCLEAQITPHQIETIFLGGGFGFFLDVQDILLLHMLPDLPPERIRAMGNTCLQGLYQCAVELTEDRDKNGQTADAAARGTALPVTTVNLAEHGYFKERFIRHLSYEDV